MKTTREERLRSILNLESEKSERLKQRQTREYRKKIQASKRSCFVYIPKDFLVNFKLNRPAYLIFQEGKLCLSQRFKLSDIGTIPHWERLLCKSTNSWSINLPTIWVRRFECSEVLISYDEDGDIIITPDSTPEVIAEQTKIYMKLDSPDAIDARSRNKLRSERGKFD